MLPKTPASAKGRRKNFLKSNSPLKKKKKTEEPNDISSPLLTFGHQLWQEEKGEDVKKETDTSFWHLNVAKLSTHIFFHFFSGKLEKIGEILGILRMWQILQFTLHDELMRCNEKEFLSPFYSFYGPDTIDNIQQITDAVQKGL